MTKYTVQPRDRIFLKGYEFLPFAKNIGKNIGENMSKNLSGKYNPGMLAMGKKLFDYAKQSATDALKTNSKRVIKITEEEAGDLTGNKIANKVMRVSNNSQQNHSDAVINKHDK